MASFNSIKSVIFDREDRKRQYQAHIRGLNAYDRHKKFLNDYVTFYGKERSTSTRMPIKTDRDTLREGYRFIRSEEDDQDSSWEQKLVKRYYDKLFKEYCIADMSHYKIGKIGLRWRTEKEVMSGKGQFICGNKHCDEKNGLSSYEVNFSYIEAGENKQALVKLVACERCAKMLHYKHYKRQKEKEITEKESKRIRDQSRSDYDSDDYDGKERSSSGKKHKEYKNRKRGKSDSDTDEECERSKGSKRREMEVHKRHRDVSSSSSEDQDKKYTGSKEKTKGKRASSSSIDRKTDDDDNFDEYLDGMFP